MGQVFRPSDSAAIIRFSRAIDVLFVAHLNKPWRVTGGTPMKKPFCQLGFALELGDFFGLKAGGVHPFELTEGGRARCADVRDGNNQSGCGLGWRLAETQLDNPAQ
jgi:hypothetical protein